MALRDPVVQDLAVGYQRSFDSGRTAVVSPRSSRCEGVLVERLLSAAVPLLVSKPVDRRSGRRRRGRSTEIGCRRRVWPDPATLEAFLRAAGADPVLDGLSGRLAIASTRPRR